jgi:hypothetical protein
VMLMMTRQQLSCAACCISPSHTAQSELKYMVLVCFLYRTRGPLMHCCVVMMTTEQLLSCWVRCGGC